jgi:uncharacterized SAM-binding protein YcdF (DUF218 family)
MNALHSPLTLALIAGLLAGGGLVLGHRRLAAAALLVMLVALALATPLGANLLVRAIEAPQPAETQSMASACPTASAVVFLSGGLRREPVNTRDFGALTGETLDRILALQASESLAAQPLIVSGGGPFQLPEAEVIATFLRELKRDMPPIIIEGRSTSTRDSAAAVAKLISGGPRRIVLATSALHMPRARWTFERAGFEVCPWALNSRYVPVDSPAALWPQSTSLDKAEWALYELLGTIYYRLTIPRSDP